MQHRSEGGKALSKQNRNTWLFVFFLVLAATANVLSKVFSYGPDSLMTCFNYVILTGLLLFWAGSVRIRLLPSHARTYVYSAALLLLLYMLLRIFKYRFTVEPAALRYLTYAYWIPQMLVPALFLMACIRIRQGSCTDKKPWEALLLIPGFLSALTVMTNDLHFLVYVPKPGIPCFDMETGTYSYGPAFYCLYIWMILAAATGLILLFLATGRLQKRAVLELFYMVTLWFGIVLLNILYLDRYSRFHPFKVPDAHTFGMLGVMEICIRHRLIPYNENYSGFFRILRMPVLITDRAFRTVYHTESILPAGEVELKASLKGPLELAGDRKLSGTQIRGGYAFWAEDESGIRQAQKKLTEANETIEQENELIRAETEQKEKNAYLQSRHHIYHEIAEKLYPTQKKISQLLDSTCPGTEGFRDSIAGVSVLNAYVKRKTNLLLLAAEKDSLDIRELSMALQESADYLTLAGLRTTVRVQEDGFLPAERIVQLYDAFEQVAEQLLYRTSSMMISLSGGVFRFAAAADKAPDMDGIMLPVKVQRSEDILYMDIFAGKEEEAL